MHDGAVPKNALSLKVNLCLSNPHQPLNARCWRCSAATQHGADSRRELARREWLRHVIIGAKVEPSNAICLRRFRRHHDHWDAGIRTNGTTHLNATHLREHEVKEHKVGCMRSKRSETSGACRRLLHREAFSAQRIRECLA